MGSSIIKRRKERKGRRQRQEDGYKFEVNLDSIVTGQPGPTQNSISKHTD